MPDASALLRRAWEEASWALGIAARDDVLRALAARWSEPHRRYHDLAHLEACLRSFEAHRALATRPGEVLASLLFHDAVYDPQRSDNEAESAALARRMLAGAQPEALDRIAASILATRSHEASDADDTALVLDVDLAILGAPPDVYDAFERAIRDEYAFVPPDAFRRGRRALLTGLLARPRIYAHAALRDALETFARANLARSLARLTAA